jgi:hypothetical protein
MEPPLSEEEVLRQIKKVKEYALAHQSELPQMIYDAMNGLSKTLVAYKEKHGQEGWANTLVDTEGNPIWSEDQRKELNELLPGTIRQAGGALSPGDVQYGVDSKFVAPVPQAPIKTDGLVENVQSYLTTLDEKNKELANIVGPVAMIRSLPGGEAAIPAYPPYIPVKAPIPTNLIVTSINAVLEACRLLVSNNVIDIGILRKILSIVLAVYDILRGDWRSGVLSMLGFFSRSMVFYGVLGKITLWVYNLISPDIRSRISDDMVAGAKSAVLGFWLWFLALVSPEHVRTTINTMVATASKPLEELNKQIEAVEKQAQAAAAPIGARVSFPRVPLNQMPSFDDIQNFQSILHQPEVFCSDGFQAAIQPGLAVPAIRIVLDLANIPTTPEGLAKACAGVPKSVKEAVVQKLQPTVVLQKGGKKTRKNKLKKKSTRKQKG